MGTKKRKLTGKYREGAKGHCYECGRPEGEHRGGECPDVAERNDFLEHVPRTTAKTGPLFGGIGFVR